MGANWRRLHLLKIRGQRANRTGHPFGRVNPLVTVALQSFWYPHSTQPLFDVAWGSNSHMNAQKKDPAHEELLSVLQTAKNRLEYVTQNDWMLIVDRAKRTVFKKDDVLIQAGKQNKTVYLLAKGSAKVESTKVFIAQIEAGEICGEMAFLENGVASASVLAAGELEVCAIEWPALLDLFELYPHLGSRFYRSLAVNLSRRLREAIGAKPTAKGSG